MKNLITLVKMQLKEKLNTKRSKSDDTSLFNTAVSILGVVLKFLLVTALCYVIITLVGVLGLFSLNGTIPASVMSIVFSLMLLLSIFSCTVGITKAMYFSRDNFVLLTLPCKPIQVYLSKLVIFFFFELKKNFAFIIPLFIAYFISHGYSWYFYPWLLICYVFISLFTVGIGALLSIPAMWLSGIFRQHRYLQIFSIAVIVAAAVTALFYAISLIPPHIDLRMDWPNIFWNIQNMLEQYTIKLVVLYDLTRLILGDLQGFAVVLLFGKTALRMLLLIGATVILHGLGLLVVQPLFYSMASKPFEYLKKKVKPKKNFVLGSKLTAFYNEFLKLFKDSGRLLENVGITISVPILIFFLNKVFYAMNTKELGDYMVLAFNLLIIMLVVLNANTYAASVYSRDGRSAYLIKVQPSSPYVLLLAKLVPSTVFCMISLAVTLFIIRISTSLSTLDAVCMIVGVFFIYLAHLLYCAETDIMNPQTEIYAAMGEHENNPNEAKATVTAFLISFLVAGATLLLLIENANPVFPKFMIVGMALFAYQLWMFLSKIKLYYKER